MAGAYATIGHDWTEGCPDGRPREQSSYSGNGGGNCIEVAAGDRVLVRDSQDRDGTVLRFPPAAWHKFADRVKRS